jgi:hypothetical protein
MGQRGQVHHCLMQTDLSPLLKKKRHYLRFHPPNYFSSVCRTLYSESRFHNIRFFVAHSVCLRQSASRRHICSGHSRPPHISTWQIPCFPRSLPNQFSLWMFGCSQALVRAVRWQKPTMLSQPWCSGLCICICQIRVRYVWYECCSMQ